MGKRNGGRGERIGQGRAQDAPTDAVGGISGQWGTASAGAGFTTASAYPTAMVRPGSAQGEALEGRQLRWAA